MSTVTFEEPGSARNVCADATFPVEYKPAMYLGGEFDTPMVPRVDSGKNFGKPKHVFVVRTDPNTALGLHSSRYDKREDGYRTVIDTAESLFPTTTESCTVYGDGEKLLFTQKIGDDIDVGHSGDVLLPRLVWVSSLNGTWATSVFNMMSRPSCDNQLYGATPLWKAKRTTNHGDLVEIRAEILAKQVAEAERFAFRARIMNDITFTDREFRKIVDQLVPVDFGASDRALRNVESKRGSMFYYWRKEVNAWGLEGQFGNAWLAYNAIQGAEQHHFSKGSAHAKQQAVEGKTPYAKHAMDLLMAGMGV